MIYNFHRLSNHSAKMLLTCKFQGPYSSGMFKALSVELCIKSLLKLHLKCVKCTYIYIYAFSLFLVFFYFKYSIQEKFL